MWPPAWPSPPGFAQIAYLKLRRSPIDAMQWMSLGLVVVFGGASLLTHDPRFIMFKPTLIYVAIGAVMLKRGWMTRYMPPVALPWGARCGRGVRLCLGRADVPDRRRSTSPLSCTATPRSGPG